MLHLRLEAKSSQRNFVLLRHELVLAIILSKRYVHRTNWPDHKALPLPARGLTWDPTPAIPFDEIFTAAPKDALSLLRSILVLDPNMRFTASQCLSHPYFSNDPPRTPKENLILRSTDSK